MRHGVDHGFEQRLFAVLRHVHARRLLARRDLHIAHRERHRLGDLPVQRPGNLLRIDLAGGAIPSPVPGRGNARATQPLFGIPGTQQQAGHCRAHDAVLVGRQKREFLERRLGVRCALGAQQRFPERPVECSEARARHRLLVEPTIPGLPPSLRQARSLVGAHRAPGPADPDIASARAVVLRIAPGDFQKQDSLAAGELLAPAANAHGRFYRVGADLDQEGLERVYLFAGHALRRSVVGDAAEHGAAVRIGERRNFVRPIVPFRALRPVAGELDPLELPTAVFAQPQPALDVGDAVAHRPSPNPGPDFPRFSRVSGFARDMAFSIGNWRPGKGIRQGGRSVARGSALSRRFRDARPSRTPIAGRRLRTQGAPPVSDAAGLNSRALATFPNRRRSIVAHEEVERASFPGTQLRRSQGRPRPVRRIALCQNENCRPDAENSLR